MKHRGPLFVLIFMCSYVAAQANVGAFCGSCGLNYLSV